MKRAIAEKFKKLISGVTSAAIAATMAFGGTDLGLMSSYAEPESPRVFTLDNATIGSNNANDLFARFDFKDLNGAGVNNQTDANTYYLLLHATGQNADWWTYSDGAETHEYYKLVEINANGTDATVSFDGLVTDHSADQHYDWQTQRMQYTYPSTKLIEGSIIKNENPEQPLTLSSAQSLTGCKAVTTLNGFEVSNGNSLNVITGNGWVQNTVAMDAVTGRSVIVKSFDENDNPAPIKNDADANYYVLGLIYEKGADQKTAKPLAWSLVQVDLENNSVSNAAFVRFYKYGDDGSTKGDTILFDPSEHDFATRVWWSESELATYKDLADGKTAGTAFDSIQHYKPGSSTENGVTTVTFTHYHIDYDLVLTFDKDSTITAGDYLYVLVTATHSSTATTYLGELLAPDNEKIDVVSNRKWVFHIQSDNDQLWTDGNGNPTGINGRYYGSPTEEVTVQLIKGSQALNMNGLTNGTNSTVIENGEIVKSFKVSYDGVTTEEDDDDNRTSYTYNISFSKSDAASEYDFVDILGKSLNVGLTADRFEQIIHAETNFATNNYQGNDAVLEPDLSGKFGGNIYISKYVNFLDEIRDTNKDNYTEHDFLDPSMVVEDPNGKIAIGDAHCDEGMILTTDDPSKRISDKSRLRNGTDGFVAPDPMPAGEIKDNIIDPALAEMVAMSDTLAKKTANVDAQIIKGTAYVDTTGFGKYATIYVNGDAIVDCLGSSSGLILDMKEGQTIVFNFTKSKTVRIDEFVTRVFDDNGDLILPPGVDPAQFSLNDLTTAGGSHKGNNVLNNVKNTWLGKYATRQVVFNFNSAEYIEIDKAAGIFLMPKKDSVTKVTGTSSGWLVTNGYVSNTGGEWHFLYDGVPGNTTKLTVSKQAITGTGEIKGAELQIVSVAADTGKETVIYDWTSGDKAKQFKLAPGDYILRETGKTFEFNGTTYQVTPSELKFTVEAIPDSYDCKIIVDKDQDALKVDEENGYYKYDEETKKATICDAELVDNTKTKIEISKRDINGTDEVYGAKIEIYDAKDGKIVGEKPVESWISSKDNHAQKTFSLSDGEYALKESSIDNSSNDKSYKIVESTVYFTVKDGKVTSVTNNTTEGDEVNGYVTYTPASNETATAATNAKFQINDAELLTTEVKISKTDIGGKQLEGAKLEIIDVEAGKTVAKNESTSAEEDWVVAGVVDVDKVYELKETTAPDGYTVAESIFFKVDNQNKVYTSETADGEFKAAGKVVMKDAPTKVSISKTDIGGKQLEGAKLEIIDVKSGETVAKNESTSAEEDWVVEGVVVVDKVYELKETTAPDGYTVAESIFFKVDNQNKVYTSETADGEFKAAGKVVMKDAPTKVNISKTDIGGKQLEGAKLEIIDVKAGKTVAKNESTSAEEDWVVEGVVVVDKIYELKETTAPDGYTVAESIFFKVDNQNKVYTSETADGEFKAAGKVVMKDAPTKVNIRKTDTGGKQIEGAKLEIIDVKSGETVAKNESTSAEEDWVVEGVVAVDKVYELKETTAPDGYEVAESIFFKVDNDNNVTVSATADGTFTAPSKNVVIMEDEKKTKIEITKTDIAGTTEVKGAKIELFKADDKLEKTVGDAIDEWVSSESEPAHAFVLEGGNYALKETSVDNKQNDKSYKIVDSTIFFTVKDGKVINVVNNTTKGDENGFVTNEGNKFQFNDAELKGAIMLSKTDIAGTTEVKGAKITITNVDTKESIEWVSGGKENTVSLSDGTYTMKETAVDNETGVNSKSYKIVDSTITFTVDGGVVKDVINNTVENDKVNGFVTNNGNKFQFNDAELLTDIDISKRDITGKDEVYGAKIEIFEAKNGEITGEKPVKTWESSEDNKAQTTFSLSDGEYALKETSVDNTKNDGNSYVIVPSTVYFTVKNGEVSNVRGTSDGTTAGSQINGYVEYTEAGNNTNAKFQINDAEKFTEIELSKRDVTGKDEVYGATIEIFETVNGQPEGDAVITWISSENDHAQATFSLRDGTYALKEKSVDNKQNTKSYKIVESTVYFTVKDGKVKDVTGVSDGAAAGDKINGYVGYTEAGDSTNAKFQINDAEKLTDIELSKTDIAGTTEVKGAKIEIKGVDNNFKTEWVSGESENTVSLSDGKYTMKETGVDNTKNDKSYNIVDSTIEFTVKDGTVTVTKNETTAGDEKNGFVTNNGNKFQFNDAELKGAIMLSKTDIAGTTEVKGAKIEIKGADENNKSFSETWVSGGKENTISLSDGKYTMKETAVDNETGVNSKSYKIIDSTITFTIKEGKVVADSVQGTSNGTGPKDKTDGYVSNNGNSFTFNDAEIETPIDISKFDISGENEVKGAKIEIFEAGNTETPVVVWISGESDKTIYLTDGAYTMKETSVDNTKNEKAYSIVPSTVTFTVKNGKVVKDSVTGITDGATAGANTNGYVSYTEASNDKNDKFQFNDAELKGEIMLSKTDIAGTTEVKGAKIVIEGKNINYKTEWVSGESDKVISLSDGQYAMRETEVDNSKNDLSYKVIDSTIIFTVKEGKVTVDENKTVQGDEVNGFVTNNDNEFKFNDAELKTEFELSKYDITGENEVKGAKILITNEFGKKITEWVSGESDKTVSLSDGKYIMKETEVDNSKNKLSYNIVPSSVEFTVKNGKVTVQSGVSEGATAGSSNGYVKFTDATETTKAKFQFNDAEKTTDIELSKTDIAGTTEVKGAKIRIDGVDNVFTTEWVSGESDQKVITLSDGKYTMKETGIDNDQNDKTYKIIESTIEFTVKDGEVTVTKNDTTAGDDENGFVTFTPADDDTNAVFKFNDAEEVEEDDSSSDSEDESSDSEDESSDSEDESSSSEDESSDSEDESSDSEDDSGSTDGSDTDDSSTKSDDSDTSSTGGDDDDSGAIDGGDSSGDSMDGDDSDSDSEDNTDSDTSSESSTDSDSDSGDDSDDDSGDIDGGDSSDESIDGDDSDSDSTDDSDNDSDSQDNTDSDSGTDSDDSGNSNTDSDNSGDSGNDGDNSGDSGNDGDNSGNNSQGGGSSSTGGSGSDGGNTSGSGGSGSKQSDSSSKSPATGAAASGFVGALAIGIALVAVKRRKDD